jgi:hypothetical protein
MRNSEYGVRSEVLRYAQNDGEGDVNEKRYMDATAETEGIYVTI